MLKSYLVIALRTLRKQRGYAAITVIGLGLGMACCVLIAAYVWDELHYDRFHSNAERVHRIRVERFAADGSAERTANSSLPMAPAVLETVPEVEAVVRVRRRSTGSVFVAHGEKGLYEDGVIVADSSFFEVFDGFRLLRGSAQTSLAEPYAVVLTASTARRYFGDADPVGQTMEIDGADVRVTGIVEDPPLNAHFSFDFIVSLATLDSEFGGGFGTDGNWWGLSYYTYLRLHPQADVEAVGAALRELPRAYIPKQEDDSGYRQLLYLQPLTSIHLTSHYEGEFETNGYTAYVWVFGAIALFILLLAVINFVNLATARAAERAAEVGMRKAMGARREQLAAQFLGESLLYALAALGAALALIQLALPTFNALAAKAIVVPWTWLPGLTAFALGVGILAGIYPALMLSGFQPASVLKGQRTQRGRGEGLRKGLIVFQFAVSVALVTGVFAVGQQLRYMQSQHLGFDRDRLVTVGFNKIESIEHSLGAFREALLETPAVRSVTFSGAVPGRLMPTNVIAREPGMTEAGQTFTVLPVEYDYVETYGLELVAGRAFDPGRPDSAAFVLNETALHRLGWTDPQDALGEELTRQFGDTRTVVGVVKDFHLAGLQEAIPPVVLYLRPEYCNYATLNIAAGEERAGLAGLQAAWARFAPDRPLDYRFMDAAFGEQYRSEERVATVIRLFTGLALILACLGLLGLVAFTTQQRTREIGIRKVLGASVLSLLVLLTRDVARLILLAIVVAAPLAWWAIDRWLQGFAYRIEMGPGVFVLAGLAALALALLTVSGQALRAATADPVRSLHHE